jgi:hypothetical protein
MEVKHTPGPWFVGKATEDEGHRIVSAPGTNPCHDDPNGAEWIATVYDTTARGPGPNARLVSVAPVAFRLMSEAYRQMVRMRNSGRTLDADLLRWFKESERVIAVVEGSDS